MDYLNPNEIAYCNIDKWHDAGYTGKGVKIAVFDIMPKVDREFIKKPFFNINMPEYTHGDKVIDVLHQVAPEAAVYIMPQNKDQCRKYNVLEYILREGISIANVSQSGVLIYPEDLDFLLNNNIKFFGAAGNEADDTYPLPEGEWLRDNRICTVGAVHMEDGFPKWAKYSCFGKGYVDTVGFSNVLNRYSGKQRGQGTSYSCPWVAGMCALYEQWFMQQYGRTVTVAEFRNFLLANTMDLGKEGHDQKHGHGLFILPEKIDGDDKVDRILTLEQLVAELENYNYKELHIHHTWKPDHSDWNKHPDGLYWSQSMRNYHINSRGWQDIGQHVTLCPDGTFVTGRDFCKTPASITGCNTGAFCVEMIGNFDIGCDKLAGAQKEAMIGLARHFDSKGRYIRFHRENAPKTCPGTGIDKDEFIKLVKGDGVVADEFTRGIQGALKTKGLYCGETDGIPGPAVLQGVRDLINRLTVAERSAGSEQIQKAKELAKKILEI